MNVVLTNDGKNSGFIQVGANNVYSTHTVANREITKSGYLYIYVSNETPNIAVFFDQLQVTHIRGPLLQEEGYYPFGLEMKAISSQAFVISSGAKQSYKFNGGTELNESFDVDYYETYFRNYDAQIGRFTGIDALAEANINQSPYAFANNDPNYYNDPTGLDAWNQVWQYDLDHPVGTTPNGPPIDGGGGINDYGGTLSFNNDGTFTYTPFSSSFEEFMAGATYADTYNLWGQYGFANSWESAAHEYSKTYHETPLRPIVVTAHNEFDIYHNAWIVPDDIMDLNRQLRQNGFAPGDLDNFWSNLGWATRMTSEWAFYFGPQQRTFNNDAIAGALMNSRIVGEARNFWYDKVNAGNPITSSVTNFKGNSRVGGGNFGFTGLLHAGLDPIEQFMGSTSQFTINSDGKTLTYTITNVTSFQSLMYGLTPSFLNFYNTTQTYIFTEPINLNRIHP